MSTRDELNGSLGAIGQWLALPAAGLALIVAIVSPQPLQAIAVLFGAGLIAVAVAQLAVFFGRRVRSAARSRRARPEFLIEPGDAPTHPLSRTQELGDYVMMRVTNSATQPQADAVDVLGKIRVWRPGESPLEILARDANAEPYPADGTEPRTDIPAGANKQFDVAVRFHGDIDAFLVNSAAFRRFDARDPRLRLAPGDHDFEFIVGHRDVTATGRFILRNRPDEPLRIVPRPPSAAR